MSSAHTRDFIRTDALRLVERIAIFRHYGVRYPWVVGLKRLSEDALRLFAAEADNKLWQDHFTMLGHLVARTIKALKPLLATPLGEPLPVNQIAQLLAAHVRAVLDLAENNKPVPYA